MNRIEINLAVGWGVGLAASAGLQVWWWAGNGPGWLPVLTGPVLAAATLGIDGAFRRRSDPELAAREALQREAGELAALSSRGVVRRALG